MFRGGRESGSIIALVVQISAAAKYRYTKFRQYRFNSGVEFVFAIVAARAVVPDVVGVVEFLGLNDAVVYPDQGS